MSLTKRILVLRKTWPPLVAVGTVLLGLGQVAAQPPANPRMDAKHPMVRCV
jgi:hypothetical protein